MTDSAKETMPIVPHHEDDIKKQVNIKRNFCNFLVFALIAPIGCRKKIFFEFMEKIRTEFNFEITTIKIGRDHLTDFIKDDKKGTKKIQLIDVGNEMRECFENQAKGYAILVIKPITDIIIKLIENSEQYGNTHELILNWDLMRSQNNRDL
jgi:hypothetical protein